MFTNDGTNHTQNSQNNQYNDYENQKVFMALDIKGTSFRSSNYSKFNKNIIIFVIWVVAYIIPTFSMLDFLKTLMDTVHYTKPLIVILIGFVLVEQYPFRKYLLEEDVALELYENLINNKFTHITEFYNIKPNGLKVTPEGYCRIEYRDGRIGYVVKVLRGSKSNDFIKNSEPQTTALNAILYDITSLQLDFDYLIADEHVERDMSLRFFQQQISKLSQSSETGDAVTQEFKDLCNETVLLHNYQTSNFCFITSTYILVSAKTKFQLDNLEKYISQFSNSRIKGSNLRDLKIINKKECINLFCDQFSLKDLNEKDFIAENVSNRVSLGKTEIVACLQLDEEYVETKDYSFLSPKTTFNSTKIDTYDLNKLFPQTKQLTPSEPIQPQLAKDSLFQPEENAFQPEENATFNKEILNTPTTPTNLFQTEEEPVTKTNNHSSILEDIEIETPVLNSTTTKENIHNLDLGNKTHPQSDTSKIRNGVIVTDTLAMLDAIDNEDFECLII